MADIVFVEAQVVEGDIADDAFDLGAGQSFQVLDDGLEAGPADLDLDLALAQGAAFLGYLSQGPLDQRFDLRRIRR